MSVVHDAGADVVDAHVVLTAFRHRRAVLTSDPDDLQALSGQLPPPVELRLV